MGLDMYFTAFPVNATEEILNSDTTTEEQQRREIICKLKSEIGYFRKHADLHGWFADKWLENHTDKTADDFNTLYMEITPELLEKLTTYANKRSHKKYTGCFWGTSEPEQRKHTKKLCKEIKTILDSGLGKLFYYSWW